MKQFVLLSAMLFFASTGVYAAYAPTYPCNCAQPAPIGYKNCVPHNVSQCIIDGDPVAALKLIKEIEKVDKENLEKEIARLNKENLAKNKNELEKLRKDLAKNKWLLAIEKYSIIRGSGLGASGKPEDGEPNVSCGIVSLLAYYPATEMKSNKKVPISVPNKQQVSAIEDILKRITTAFKASEEIKKITYLSESDKYAAGDKREISDINSKGTGYSSSDWGYKESAVNFLCQGLKPIEHAVAANNVNFVAAFANLKANKENLLFTLIPVENGKRCVEGSNGNYAYAFIVGPLTEQDFMMRDNYMPIVGQCNNADGFMDSENPYKGISVLNLSGIYTQYDDKGEYIKKDKMGWKINQKIGLAGDKNFNTNAILKSDYKTWKDLPVQVQRITEIFAKVTAPTKTTSGMTIYVSPTYEGGGKILADYYNGNCSPDTLREQFPLIPATPGKNDLAGIIMEEYSKKGSTVTLPCQI